MFFSLNIYTSRFNINAIYFKNACNFTSKDVVYKKSKIITINTLSNIIKIYNGRFMFRKYASIWSFGIKCGQLVWTKKKAKYKSKLKLKIKIKMLSQKKQQQEQKSSLLIQRKLYNRFKKIIIPKSYLNKIKSNTKLR